MDGQPDDLDLLTRTILSEAGSQGPLGMAAVAAVVKNRMQKRGMSAGDVVLEQNQFEPFNGGAGNPNDPMKWDANSPRYAQARKIAQGVMSGDLPDFSGGATHFANVATVRQRNGGGVGNHGWINDRNRTAQIGGHTFFAPEGRVDSNSMAQNFWRDPSGGNAAPGMAPIGSIGSGAGAPSSDMPAANAQPAAQSPATPPVSRPMTPPPTGAGSGMASGNSPAQPSPPILGRLLFGDQGMSGFLRNAIPTPANGQGMLGGMLQGLGGGASGAGAAAGAGGPMAALAQPAAAAAPAMASAAAPAAAGGASALGSMLSSLFALI